MKIWIDLDNTPHVPFFIPIIRELEGRGHSVGITARDAFQVCQLADKMGVPYLKVGRHYGKNPFLKVFGMAWRAGELLPFYRSFRPDLALSHGARSQVLLCNLVRIPSVLIADYEFARILPLARPKWMLTPDALSAVHLPLSRNRVYFYRGLKEDVYAPDFRPDPSLLTELGINEKDLIVTIRPPANEAHYYNPESDVLFYALMSRVVRTDGLRAVLLPRNKAQHDALRASHEDWFSSGKTIVPPRVISGMNLLWYSDLVVSGGGTMNREAAALGIPVYSIFRGQTGAIDRKLENEGRLTIIRDVEEVNDKIKFAARDKSSPPDSKPRNALTDIVGSIEAIMKAL